MKKISLFLILLTITTLYSCKDEEVEVKATEMSTEISRLWACSEIDDQGTRNYEVTIEKDTSNTDKIIIKNFHNTGKDNKIEGTISSDRIITVADQDLQGTTYLLKECTGEISADFQRITWTYKIDDPQTEIYSVSATYTPGQISKSGEVL